MADTIYSRIITTHDTEEMWNSRPAFVPYQGEQIVYDADANHNYSRVKIGDGRTPLIDLPFVINAGVQDFFNVKNDVCYIDGGRIVEYSLKGKE